MHLEVKRFWERLGQVLIQTEPNDSIGLTNVTIYWFDKDNSSQRIIIAAPVKGTLVYRVLASTSWVNEDIMLKIIRLKAFL
jgi:hypothetical protein